MGEREREREKASNGNLGNMRRARCNVNHLILGPELIWTVRERERDASISIGLGWLFSRSSL
jgi:hypothetical protein